MSSATRLPAAQLHRAGRPLHLQQLDFGKLKLETGARYEYSPAFRAAPEQPAAILFGTRSYDAFSASAGASYAVVGEWRIGANLSHTIRAPSAEELFANGPHGGTEAYEVGDPDLATERSWGLEGVLKGRGRDYTFEGVGLSGLVPQLHL